MPMKVLIAGLGLMGGSLALALKQRRPDVTVWGYDLPQVLQEAQEKKLIHHAVRQWPAEGAQADVIFLATPLEVIKKHLKDLNGVVEKRTLVTDMGSTKQEIQHWVEKINFSGTYVGGHPMTGAEKSGLAAANPLLFENAVYILTPAGQSLAAAENLLFPLLQALKARILLLDAKVHDQIMAAISHLPQLLAIALVNLVGSKEDEEHPYFELAAGGFRDLTRIASSSINIWQDIIRSNRENIQQVLQEMIDLLTRAKENLLNLGDDFERANVYRSRIPKKGKGFIHPLVDVIVYVTDQVGVIAKISNTLAREAIDIRDIELLKIREREGGVFRLSFTSLPEAQTAVRLLTSIGYHATIKE